MAFFEERQTISIINARNENLIDVSVMEPRHAQIVCCSKHLHDQFRIVDVGLQEQHIFVLQVFKY